MTTQMTASELYDLAVEIVEAQGERPELADAVRAFLASGDDPYEELLACVVAMEQMPEVEVADAAYVAAVAAVLTA